MNRLCSSAEAYLSIMNLTDPQAEIGRVCLSKYAMPKGFCAKLSWAVYRIVQAVRSLFGSSDWQNTLKMIQNTYIQKAILHGIMLENPQSRLEKRIYRKAAESCALIAKTHLANALLCQEEKKEITPEFLERLQGISFQRQIARMQNLRESATRRWASQ